MARQNTHFDPSCRRCDRLARYLDQVREQHPDYYCGPVPPFGDPNARLVIVGLAPGKHGANATGRPFTGDYAGLLLYVTLHKFGYASKPESKHVDDGLTLSNCRISNAVKCLPPDNKPNNSEVSECLGYLKNELGNCAEGTVLLALGTIAHKAILKAFALTQVKFPFAHGRRHVIDERITLVDSYHCSRYNTQTGRLTARMFEQVFEGIGDLLG